MEEEQKSSETISIKKDSLWKFATFFLLVVVVIGGIYFFTQTEKGPTGGTVTDIPSNAQPTVVKSVSVDDDAVLGNKNAKVTIVEFSDYECPFCGRHFEQTMPQIKKDYIDTGKVKLVFRDFPLSFHPSAQKAAEAAECAGEQGKYFEMHDKLYSDQNSLNVDTYKKYAKEIGLDTTKFNDCLDSGKMASEIKKDMSDGQSYGVQGTPAFFINGKMISGAQPYANFKQVIDAELA